LGDSGADFHAVVCDVTDTNAVQSVFDRIAAQHGPVQNLIYNAHELFIGPFAETNAGTFERIWRVNTLGAFLCAQSAIPQMMLSGGGAVIFSGATASLRGGGRFAAFAGAGIWATGHPRCACDHRRPHLGPGCPRSAQS
jgi:NAD(P)-dependent dehydrogenase (short-subunit alcohol dehydrogenase family)